MSRFNTTLDGKRYSLKVYRQVFQPVETSKGVIYVDTGSRVPFDWEDHISEGELFEVFKLAKGLGFIEILDAGLSNEIAKSQLTISRATEQPKLSRQFPRLSWLPVKHVETTEKKSYRVG